MSQKNTLGVIGLSTMGANLAMNLADHDFRVGIYNRSSEKTDMLMQEYTGTGVLAPAKDLATFVAGLESPRKIILMVKAGEAVDEMLEQLSPLLEQGDIVIDGGNSFFQDTLRREKASAEKGFSFVGMGISGGEEGARRGPSLMPGGSAASYALLSPILEAIAAKDFGGNACVTHLGANGAGHYVKMTHNGIEYADMELIAETYWIMKHVLLLENDAIAEIFTRWNTGRLNSYLIEITANILKTKDTEGHFIVDRILDSAGSKGTGKWTAEEILALGVPGFALFSSVLARYASREKESRLELAAAFPKATSAAPALSVETLENALYAGKILCYAEGFALLTQAEAAYGWTLDFAEIARIWQGGCIIRATLLKEITAAFHGEKSHFLLTPFVQKTLTENIPALRETVLAAIRSGVPIPTFAASLSAFDTITAAELPANLIQAQRDYFGAHTFQTEIGGTPIHWKWEQK
jgi:6-phosphogluconate dehydrogenase